MVLKSRRSLKSLVVSCLLAGGLAPLSSALSAVPALPIASSVLSTAKNFNQVQAELPPGIKLFYHSSLASLYTSNNMQLMWQDNDAVQQFQQQLAELALSGVQPQFIQWVKWLADPSINGMSRDIILSDAMLGYLQFVGGVEANGSNWLYGASSYKMTTPSTTLIDQWQRALREGTMVTYITALAPQHPLYAEMHDALKVMLADHKPWPKIAETTSLRPGELSNDIPALRDILTRTGMMTPTAQELVTPTLAGEAAAKTVVSNVDDDLSVDETAGKPIAQTVVVSPAATSVPNQPLSAELVPDNISSEAITDNQYSPELVEAVKRFQVWQGLDADGIIGVRTREWLNTSPQVRATLLALNIQRLRILPGKINTAIMVNIPNYSLIYYLNGNEVLSSRVIVGRPSRKTPLMSSALNNVVVNPPWNVPTTLVREDIVPKAMRDPGYFEKHGYTLLSGWSNEAEIIDPSMIDWSMVSARNFPYRVRQAPGATNSLGRYKFNMPSSDAIYLHDTPNHGLFQKDIRALSSGCVRVNKASELANMLLQDSGWNDARISSTLKAGNTTFVPIRDHVPVRLFYLTAWIAEDGKPQFRTDIYNYDSPVRVGAQILPLVGQFL